MEFGCSGISWTICKQSAPRSRQITTPTPHHSFYRPVRFHIQQYQSTEANRFVAINENKYTLNEIFPYTTHVGSKSTLKLEIFLAYTQW